MFSSLADKELKNQIRNLSAQKFEEYVANLFKDKGFTVELTPVTNDGGKDIVVYLHSRKFYVECKHFLEGAVGREVIQKLVGAGVIDGNVDGYFVITSSYFNKNAIECSHKFTNLLLFDLDDIVAFKCADKSVFQKEMKNIFSSSYIQTGKNKKNSNIVNPEFASKQRKISRTKDKFVVKTNLDKKFDDAVKEILGADFNVQTIDSIYDYSEYGRIDFFVETKTFFNNLINADINVSLKFCSDERPTIIMRESIRETSNLFNDFKTTLWSIRLKLIERSVE